MPQKQRQKPPVGEKECTNCHKKRKLSEFYMASNPQTSSDGKMVNVCKICVKKSSVNSDGSINIENFKHMLMLMDKPFVPLALNSAIDEVKIAKESGSGRQDIIGCYMKNVGNLSQYSKMSFLESMTALDGVSQKSSAITTAEKKQKDKEEVYIKQVDDFVVTDDLIDLFGEGFTKTEYRLMQKKYENLKQNYTMQTNLHQEALVTYVRFKVKEELATAAGNVGEADKWNKAAQEAADKAKLSPKQLTKSDLQGGISSISEISKALEQAVDVIKILPRYKYQPNDAPDFNIWCYINYARKLKGLPEVDYKDIYSFYDKKKDEYLSQYGDPYGIFEEDPTTHNRPNVENFIILPKDYSDDTSMDGEDE